MKRHHLVAVVVVVLSLVALLLATPWRARRQEQGPGTQGARPGQRHDTGPDAALASNTARGPSSAALGVRHALRYVVRFEGPAPRGGHNALTVALDGQLELGEAAGGAASGARRVARIVGARLQLDDAARQTLTFPRDGAEEELQRPFAFTVDERGRTGPALVDPSASSAAQGVWAQIAAATQLVRPAGKPEADAWEVVETGVNGPLRASYRRSPSGAVHKEARARPGERLPGAAGVTGQSARITADFAFADGALRSLAYVEEGEVGLGRRDGQEVMARYRAELTLRAVGPASLAWAEDPGVRALTAFDAATAAARARAPQTRATVAQLMDAARIAADRKDTAARAEVADELARKLRVAPTGVDDVAARLRNGVSHEGVERTLIEALVRADTGPAQAALSALARDPAVATPLRQRVLAGSVFVTHPTEAFRDELAALAYGSPDPGFAGMAAITLGAALQWAARQEAERAAAAAAAARMAAKTAAFLAPPSDPTPPATPHASRAPSSGRDTPRPVASATVGEIRQWVTALGNTGLPEALPPLLSALRDPRERLRVAAALALRWQDPAAVAGPMGEAMREDDSIHVRSNLVEAARFLGPEHLLPLVRKALFSDRSEWVRSAAAHTMAVWALEAPGLRSDLEQALERDASSKVRETLRNFLEPGRVAAPFARLDHVDQGEVTP